MRDVFAQGLSSIGDKLVVCAFAFVLAGQVSHQQLRNEDDRQRHRDRDQRADRVHVVLLSLMTGPIARRPERYTLLYQFSPEDTFELTPEGESILYILKKERFSQRAILASVGFAAASFFATIISWFIG